MAHQQSYPTIWEVPDDLWEIIRILLDEYDPPASTGRPVMTGDRFSTRSSIASAAGVSGIICPGNSETIRKFTGFSSIGSNSESLKRSGPSC